MKKYYDPDFQVILFDIIDATNSDDEFFGGGGDDGGDIDWSEIDPESQPGGNNKIINW